MSTFWLKVAGIAVLVLVVIVAIGIFTGEDKPERQRKTFYDQAQEDQEKFLTKPEPVNEQSQEPAKPANDETPTEPPVQPSGTQSNPVEPTQLYFKPLSEIDEVEAERLLNVAAPGRSIGRLPMTGFKLMVDTCRQIISKWPDSWYAYQAKRMLADMPPRFRPRYKITDEELDISEFTEQRPGTQPYNIKELR